MRISGVIGYGEQTQIRPGVIEDVITEYKYRGDVLFPTVRTEQGESVHDDLRVGNQISVVASAYHREHVFDMRYISFLGVLWKIAAVDLAMPRLLVRLGGKYDGPTPEPSDDSGGDSGE